MDESEPAPIKLLDIIAARHALREFDKASREAGERLLMKAPIETIECFDPGRGYSTDIAVPGEDACTPEVYYEDSEGSWFFDCDCEVGMKHGRCQHSYALLKTLIAMHSETEVRALSAGKGPSGTGKAGRSDALAAADDPAPPFDVVVKNALGRALKPSEAKFLDALALLRKRLLTQKHLFFHDLHNLGVRAQGISWERLDILPQPPHSDHELWLYIACYLRQHRSPIPDFLEPLSRDRVVEERVARWREEVEVGEWKKLLTRASGAVTDPVETSPPVELRVRIEPSEAFVEWRFANSEKFTVIKPGKFSDFDQRHGDQLPSDVHLLWQSLAQRARLGYAVTLNYHENFAQGVLNRWLRLPAMVPFIVGPSGEPLERVAEPLRWEIAEVEGDHTSNYRIRLVMPDGSPAPQFVLRLEGRPMLFLSTTSVYTGPSVPKELFGPGVEANIPCRAVDSPAGMQFLQRIQAPLPPRLASRMKTTLLTPVLKAELGTPYAGSDTEYCFCDIVARDPEGRERERWDGNAWVSSTPKPAPEAGANRPSTAAENDELFEALDRSLLPEVTRGIEPAGFRWDFTWRRWSMRVTKKFPEQFVPFIKTLPPHVKVELRGDLVSFTKAEVSGEVRLDVQEAGIDWFDLKVLVNVSDTELSQAEIKLLLDARGKWVRLGEKGWRKLEFKLSKEEDEELARLGLNPHELTSEPQRLHALQLADPAAERFLDREKFEHVQRRARELKARVTPEIPGEIRAELRPYQRDGFHFLAYLSTNRFGGILADDMGLGKTLQTLTWLAWLRASRAELNRGTPLEGTELPPSLVVCPKSVCDNWRAEAERFLPTLRVRVWSTENVKLLPTETASADLHIINYAQLRTVSESIGGCDFLGVILDEGQYIKNPSSQTAMVARTLRCEHRVVLSGTPIENRLMDLWSLMSFAMPGALGNRGEFSRLFDSKEDPYARRRLSARVRPFLLRRTKAQVARDLPDRIEEDLFCELEGEQKTMYRAELKRTQAMLLGIKTAAALNKQRFHVLTSLLRLRQICCHPRLLKPDSKAPSAKAEALLETIEPLMEEGQKVLVFSQFVEALELLKEAIAEHSWPTFYLAGETENRGDLVRKFQAHEGEAVFLISLKAGGFGLNLTAASYVILFDPWWNPAVENQAIDRTHRIGQTQKVMAYRLLIKDSIEEKIRQLQRTKSQLAEDVLGEEKFSQSLSIDDLRFLFSD